MVRRKQGASNIWMRKGKTSSNNKSKLGKNRKVVLRYFESLNLVLKFSKSNQLHQRAKENTVITNEGDG